MNESLTPYVDEFIDLVTSYKEGKISYHALHVAVEDVVDCLASSIAQELEYDIRDAYEESLRSEVSDFLEV